MEKIAINFRISNQIDKKELEEEFSNEIIIHSNAFSGTEIVTVIISTSVIALDKILNFYIQKRKLLKETTIKIGSDEVELSGYTNDEINQMIKEGSLQELKKLISKENE